MKGGSWSRGHLPTGISHFFFEGPWLFNTFGVSRYRDVLAVNYVGGTSPAQRYDILNVLGPSTGTFRQERAFAKTQRRPPINLFIFIVQDVLHGLFGM